MNLLMTVPRNLIGDSTSRHSPEVDVETRCHSDIDSVRNGLFLNKTGRSAFGLDIAILMVRAVHLKFTQSSTMSMGRHQTSLWAWMILILSWTQQRQD